MIAQAADGGTLTALTESGFILGMILGQAVGIGLCRWLWINGQRAKRRRRDADND